MFLWQVPAARRRRTRAARRVEVTALGDVRPVFATPDESARYESWHLPFEPWHGDGAPRPRRRRPWLYRFMRPYR